MTAANPESWPIAAAQAALEHTRRQLFPFRLERWFLLGVAAFLDQCGRSAGGGAGGGAPPGGGAGGSRELLRLGGWWPLGSFELLLVCVALGVGFVLLLLALWLNSRGVFIYADGVATGRAELSRPWREHRQRANDYFRWYLGLVVLTLGGVALVLAMGAALALSADRRGFQPLLWLGVALVVCLFVCLLVAASLASLLLRDFVAPVQWRRGIGCRAAIEHVLSLVARYPLAFLLYVLLKIVFAVVVGIVSILAGCMTCCLGFLPVIRQTLLQPVFYFERAWSLFLLREMGEDPFPAAAGSPPLSAPPAPASSRG